MVREEGVRAAATPSSLASSFPAIARHPTMPHAPSSTRSPHLRLAAPAACALLSTAAAFASHARFGAPGDQPLPLLGFACSLAFAVAALRRATPVAIGLAALAGFPIEAAIDLVLHGGHDLLPLEFAFYGAYGLLGVLAAHLGWALGVAVTRALTAR